MAHQEPGYLASLGTGVYMYSFMRLLVYECLLSLFFPVYSTQKFVSAS